jgi:transposase
MAIADRFGLPIAVCATSASPHEVTLVEQTLDSKFTVDYPVRLIGDKAYDSNDLDTWLAEQYHLQMIAPNLSSRKVKSQDGRPLRRYKRRWRIERLFAWLQNYRAIQTRHTRKLVNYLGFILIGCILILLRYL